MDAALRWHMLRCIAFDLETAPYTGRVTRWALVVATWRAPETRKTPKRLRVNRHTRRNER